MFLGHVRLSLALGAISVCGGGVENRMGSMCMFWGYVTSPGLEEPQPVWGPSEPRSERRRSRVG